MDPSMYLDAATTALGVVLDPYRLLVLSAAVCAGLAIGIIPGIGGLVGMALLLPFTFSMDAYTALAVLLGLAAVTNTSDTIPAVLVGVPGTSAAQATIMDGYPMAQRGEAGRALSAAYTASLLGGLTGAFILALAIPVVSPFVLSIGSPELLAISIFGISMVVLLSGTAPLRGMAAACAGILVAMVGSDPQTGTLRWTFDTFYLWDGLPLVPLVLGLFALPELADMAIRRRSISMSVEKMNVTKGMLQGIQDALRNWWLVLRCGGIGAVVGAIPGLGGSVVDWIAYGHARQTVKGAAETFGKGDVRGVIAPESANNSVTSGALVPTIAFGVPGTAGMAVVLGALMIHGLTPGPSMLTTQLSVTYSLVWSIALANIIGALICISFSGVLARVTTVRYSIILPLVVVVICIGAFQSTRSWGDLYALMVFGVVGWTMKRMGWPRPPLVLGFVLGPIIENYLFISIGLYGADWLYRPVVMVLLILSIIGFSRPILRNIRAFGGLRGLRRRFGRPRPRPEDLLPALLAAAVAYLLVQSTGWPRDAAIGPTIVGGICLAAAVTSLLLQTVMRAGAPAPAGFTGADLSEAHTGLSNGLVLLRAGRFLLWIILFMVLGALIGMIPAIPVFMIAFMWFEGRERLFIMLTSSAVLTLFSYTVFDRILNIYWPSTVIGQYFPALRLLPSM